jgi:hypothetical protein
LPIETIPYRSDVVVPEQLLQRIQHLEAHVADLEARWLWKASHAFERARAALRTWRQGRRGQA